MLNVAVLVGRLTADPELRHTPSNVSVTTFTIAVPRSYTKPGEERQSDFIDIVAWRNNAEFVCKYFRKGQLIAVEGSIQTRSYEGKDGIRRKAFEIVSNNVHFTDSKRNNSGFEGEPSGAVLDTEPSPYGAAAPEKPAAYEKGDEADFQTIESDSDPDLPF